MEPVQADGLGAENVEPDGVAAYTLWSAATSSASSAS